MKATGINPANAPAFLELISPVDAPTSAGDFRLHFQSPLIDAGNNQARINGFYAPTPPIPIEGNILFDLDSIERVFDGDGDGNAQIDLGPYESPGDQRRDIGGEVQGLAGAGLVLRNNGGDDLPVTANGPFEFATPLDDGASYDVTVSAQPDHPLQLCMVFNGDGVVDGVEVTDILVECIDDPDLIFHDHYED